MSPLTARGRETRERILEVAARLMHVQGVAATSLDQVLEHSGAGKGQFYHYFPSKEELVRAVLEHQIERERSDLGPLLDRLDSWEGIRAWLRAVVRQQEISGFAGGCPVGSMAAEVSDASARLRRDLSAAFELKRRYLRDGLRRMAGRGELAETADAEGLSAFVLAALQGGLLLARTERRVGPLEATLEHAFRHLAGYGTPPPAFDCFARASERAPYPQSRAGRRTRHRS